MESSRRRAAPADRDPATRRRHGGRVPAVTKEQLLGEVEDLLRTLPTRESFDQRSEESAIWVGRAAAVLTRWDFTRTPTINGIVDDINKSLDMVRNVNGRTRLTSLLQQARADLRMKVGALSVVIDKGQVFDYFDELRKVIEPARKEVFFVDPYLDAEFVPRYLPHVASGTLVRLLGSPKQMAKLVPAVDMFAKQSGLSIQVRSSTAIHDRYLFVDRAACYVSGASFKDGARKAPAVLTQIGDAFGAMWTTYDTLWNAATVER
jgi:hypothetical protein